MAHAIYIIILRTDVFFTAVILVKYVVDRFKVYELIFCIKQSWCVVRRMSNFLMFRIAPETLQNSSRDSHLMFLILKGCLTDFIHQLQIMIDSQQFKFILYFARLIDAVRQFFVLSLRQFPSKPRCYACFGI